MSCIYLFIISIIKKVNKTAKPQTYDYRGPQHSQAKLYTCVKLVANPIVRYNLSIYIYIYQYVKV